MGAVLGRPSLRSDEDFFACGGDSVRAMQVVTRLVQDSAPTGGVAADEIQAKLLMEIFDRPTPLALAAVLSAALASPLTTGADPESNPDELPLSYPEERLWLVHRLNPESTAYNIVNLFEVSGPLDIEAVRWALSALCERHEPLRTHYDFRDLQPRKRVETAVRFDHDRIDQVITVEAALERARNLASTAFDLEAGPLLRLGTYHVGPDRWLLLLIM